jgi:hypothetical protein
MIRLWRRLNRILNPKEDIAETERVMESAERILKYVLPMVIWVFYVFLAGLVGFLGGAGLLVRGSEILIALIILMGTIALPLLQTLTVIRSQEDLIERRARRTRLLIVGGFMLGMMYFGWTLLDISQQYHPTLESWYQEVAPSVGMEIIGAVVTLVFLDVLLRSWSEAEDAKVKTEMEKLASKPAVDLPAQLRALAAQWQTRAAASPQETDLPPSFQAGSSTALYAAAAELLRLIEGEKSA